MSWFDSLCLSRHRLHVSSLHAVCCALLVYEHASINEQTLRSDNLKFCLGMHIVLYSTYGKLCVSLKMPLNRIIWLWMNMKYVVRTLRK